MSSSGLYFEPPRENVLRGAIFSLLAVPAGVIVWVLVAQLHIIVSIVAYGFALAALWLYLKGSGGFLSRTGAFIVAGVVVLTLLASFWGTMVADVAIALGRDVGGPFQALAHRDFWPTFNHEFPLLLPDYAMTFLLGAAIAALGAWGVLRRAFAATAPPRPSTTSFPAPSPDAQRASNPSPDDEHPSER